MEETKETVYISISLIMLAALLSFASLFITYRDQLASTRNSQLISTMQLDQYRAFNKYDDNIIYGDEVVELVRMYYDTGLEIYINSIDGASGPIVINEETVKHNPNIVTLNYLRTNFKSTKSFRAQVAYDSIDTSTVIGSPMNKLSSSEVTGVALEWLGNT